MQGIRTLSALSVHLLVDAIQSAQEHNKLQCIRVQGNAIGSGAALVLARLVKVRCSACSGIIGGSQVNPRIKSLTINAELDICPFRDKTVTALDLSNKGFGVEDVVVIAELLKVRHVLCLPQLSMLIFWTGTSFSDIHQSWRKQLWRPRCNAADSCREGAACCLFFSYLAFADKSQDQDSDIQLRAAG